MNGWMLVIQLNGKMMGIYGHILVVRIGSVFWMDDGDSNGKLGDLFEWFYDGCPLDGWMMSIHLNRPPVWRLDVLVSETEICGGLGIP